MFNYYYPKWLGKSLIEDDLPWDEFIEVDLKTFLETYTLHDAHWIRLMVDPNYDNQVLLVIHLDCVWFPTKDRKEKARVTQWPILFLVINEVYHIDFQGYHHNDLGRTILTYEVKENESSYQLDIVDIIGGKIQITFLGNTKVLILNKNKKVININI